MAKKEEKNELVKSDIAALPAHLQGEGRVGFENVNPMDMMFERFTLMQPLSPECQPKDGKEPKFRPGDIVRKSTEEVIYRIGAKPISFIISYYFKEWVQFGDRNDPNSQLIIDRSTDRTSKLAEHARKWTKVKNSDGKMRRMVDDVDNFIVLLDGRAHEPFLIGCARSNAKHGRSLLALTNGRANGNCPIFGGRYTLVSESETNKRNQTYYVYRFRNDTENLWASPGELEKAKSLYKIFDDAKKSGMLGGVYTDDDAGGDEEGETHVDASAKSDLT